MITLLFNTYCNYCVIVIRKMDKLSWNYANKVACAERDHSESRTISMDFFFFILFTFFSFVKIFHFSLSCQIVAFSLRLLLFLNTKHVKMKWAYIAFVIRWTLRVK